jgi:hypothetical protein
LIKICSQELKNWLIAYFSMGNPKKLSRADLPAPQIPGPEDFALFLSKVEFFGHFWGRLPFDPKHFC